MAHEVVSKRYTPWPSPPAASTIREPLRARCRPWPLTSGVCESHSFCTVSTFAFLFIGVAASAGRSQNAHGLMLDAKSPYSGYLALSFAASRSYCSVYRGQLPVSPHTTAQNTAVVLSVGSGSSPPVSSRFSWVTVMPAGSGRPSAAAFRATTIGVACAG